MTAEYRVEQIANLMQKLLAEMIEKDFCMTRDKLISVTKVCPSGNLQEAKVYISVLPDKEQKTVMEDLWRNVASFQETLNKKLRMRPVPKIIFESDSQPREAQEVETILEELKQSEKH